MDIETTTQFCDKGGCSACGGCSTSLSPDLEAQAQPLTLTPDSAISSEQFLAVIRPDLSIAWTGGVLGKPAVVTYSFGNASTLTVAPSLGTQGDWHTFTEYQKEAWRYAMELHSATSGIQLIEVSDPTKANIAINYQTLSDYSGLGWVNLPGSGQVKIDVNARYYDQYESMDLLPGKTDMLVFMLHEIGHALGMKHPYVGAVQLAAEFNHRGYTVMAHNSNPDGTYRSDFSPLDKAALEYAYGTQAAQEAMPVQWAQLAGGGLISLGNDASNTITGIRDRDLVIAGSGNDTIDTGEGDDTIDAGLGINYIAAGAGRDVLSLSNFMSTGEDFHLYITSGVKPANGWSGIFVADGVTNYFSGIDSFEFADGNYVPSLNEEVSQFTTTQVLQRIWKIIYGTNAPDSWVNVKLNAINSGQSNIDRVTQNEIKKEGWLELRGDGLTESSFSLLWERAFGEVMPEWAFDLAREIKAEHSLILELARSASADDFMNASLTADPDAKAVGSAALSDAPVGAMVETLEEGEATYGFRIVDAANIQSQRLASEISDVRRSEAAIAVELYDGRVIELPTVDRVRFLDGVLDFREAGLGTFVSRVFEALAGRTATAVEQARLLGAIDTGPIDGAIGSLVNEGELSARYAGVSVDNFARAIYRNLLGREATASEIGVVKAKLASGITRSDYLKDFILSDPVIDRLSIASESGVFFEDGSDIWVAAIWDTVFNRPLLTPSRDSNSKALDLGGTISTAVSVLFNSQEGKARYALFDDREFAGIIYQNAFGHPPDEAFVVATVARLSDGVTRLKIVEEVVRELVSRREAPEWSDSGTGGALTTFFDRIVGTTSADELEGRAWAEFLDGGSGDDLIKGNGGNDSILGGSGADTIFGGAGDDTLNGGSDADWLDGGAGSDRLIGGAGNDVYFVDSDGDTVVEVLNQGIDTVRTSLASYSLGANVENLIATTNGAHRFIGNALANAISGGAGADTLFGFAGNDTLDGGAGIDRLVGGVGDDLYIVQSGDIVVELSNQGTDTVFVTSGAGFTLSANVEALILGGTVVRGIGNADGNAIIGNATANTLLGMGGADLLHGEGGNDVLNGGDGDDTLSGGDGVDRLTGGAGADVFLFSSKFTRDYDIVNDFVSGVDRIGVDGQTFGLMASNSLSEQFFESGESGRASSAQTRFIYETDSGSLWFDADGSGAGAKSLIGTFKGAPELLASDIFVF